MQTDSDIFIHKVMREIEKVNLLDDEYAKIFFHDNIKCVQKMLRIIMDKPDLIVKTVEVQYVIDGPDGKFSVRLDVYAEDSEGRKYDIEIQKKSSGASPYRARRNIAILDVHSLEKGEDYNLLAGRESIVIFITEHDVLKGGKPIYRIERVIKETGEDFNDGTHIVYVNTAHKDYSTAIGQLIHDFRSKDYRELYISEFSDEASKITRNEEGKLVKIIREMEDNARDEGRTEGRAEGEAKAYKSVALGLIRLGKNTLEEIMSICNMTLEQVQALADTVK